MGQPPGGWGDIQNAPSVQPTEKTKLTDEVTEPVFEINMDALFAERDKKLAERISKTFEDKECQQEETNTAQLTSTPNNGGGNVDNTSLRDSGL